MTIVYKCDNCEKISYDRKELNDWFFLHAEEKDFCPECIELFRAVVKEYDKKQTVRLLSTYVDLQDHAIEKKSRIIIEHFLTQTQNEIQGKEEGRHHKAQKVEESKHEKREKKDIKKIIKSKK